MFSQLGWSAQERLYRTQSINGNHSMISLFKYMNQKLSPNLLAINVHNCISFTKSHLVHLCGHLSEGVFYSARSHCNLQQISQLDLSPQILNLPGAASVMSSNPSSITAFSLDHWFRLHNLWQKLVLYWLRKNRWGVMFPQAVSSFCHKLTPNKTTTY